MPFFFDIKRPRVTGATNHAGDLAPLHSAYGNALTQSKPSMIAHPVYVGKQWTNSVRGTMGAMSTRSATAIAVVAPSGYFGDFSTQNQSVVRAAPPWLRR